MQAWVIFKLPKRYSNCCRKALVYVELFTPFKPNPDSEGSTAAAIVKRLPSFGVMPNTRRMAEQKLGDVPSQRLEEPRDVQSRDRSSNYKSDSKLHLSETAQQEHRMLGNIVSRSR